MITRHMRIHARGGDASLAVVTSTSSSAAHPDETQLMNVDPEYLQQIQNQPYHQDIFRQQQQQQQHHGAGISPQTVPSSSLNSQHGVVAVVETPSAVG